MDNKTKKVKDLVEGDLVDMEPFLPDERLAKVEFASVESVEPETNECFVVHFDNGFSSFGFNPEQEVQLG